MRQFLCRDGLWRIYERMSGEMEKSVDALIVDAMEAFAQLAGYDTDQSDTNNSKATQVTPPPRTTRPFTAVGGGPGAAASAGAAGLGAPAARGGAVRPPPPPVPPRLSRPTPLGTPSYPGTGPGVGASPPAPVEMSAEGAPTLYLIFDSQKYRIDKDQFIIGRGSKSSDLPIKDGNISRKHAAVVRRNGTYFIKDLGSTNGIDFKGMRIDNKRIDEGDVFHLCDYELRFTYRR
jgi:hypothetical protein